MSNGDQSYPPVFGREVRFPEDIGPDKRQKVLKIPVAGPDPFNTLVVIRSGMTQGGSFLSDNDLPRFPWVPMRTHFRLKDFEDYPEGSPPPHQHSTSVIIQWYGLADDAGFVIAADEVDGKFDDDGYWTVLVSVAGQADHEDCYFNMYISSWGLCYEAPPAPLRNLKTTGNCRRTLSPEE